MCFTFTYNTFLNFTFFLYSSFFIWGISWYIGKKTFQRWCKINKVYIRTILTKLMKSSKAIKNRIWIFEYIYIQISIYSYDIPYVLRTIRHMIIYLFRISNPESYVIKTEEFSSNGLKNINIAYQVSINNFLYNYYK